MAEIRLGIFIVNREVYNLVAREARVYHTNIARRRKASVISYPFLLVSRLDVTGR